MSYVLFESGLFRALSRSLQQQVSLDAQAKHSRYRHECAWRLAQWDEGDDDGGIDSAEVGGDSDASAAYSRSRSQALKRLCRGGAREDPGRFKEAVEEVRRSLRLGLLRGSGASESATIACRGLGRFRALREMEKLSELAEAPSEESLELLLDSFESFDRGVSGANFGHLEETLLQRCIFLDMHALPSAAAAATSVTADTTATTATTTEEFSLSNAALVAAWNRAQTDASLSYVRRCKDAGFHQVRIFSFKCPKLRRSTILFHEILLGCVT